MYKIQIYFQKKIKKPRAQHCGLSPKHLNGDELSSSSGSECEYDGEQQSVSSDTNEEVK